MASCGATWGRDGTFPKLVLMLMRVPVCRLSTNVSRVISKRPVRKGVKFLSHVRTVYGLDLRLVNDQAVLCGYNPFLRNKMSLQLQMKLFT